jgi:DNA-binding NarL/FixJ family response regulator
LADQPGRLARLLLVDDHAEIRQRLLELLAEHWSVCGEAVNGPDAISEVQRLQPDLVVMDMFMPGMSGIEAAREIRAHFPTLPILLLTTPDVVTVDDARSVGIRGMVSKMASDTLVPGVQALLRGEEFFWCEQADS